MVAKRPVWTAARCARSVRRPSRRRRSSRRSGSPSGPASSVSGPSIRRVWSPLSQGLLTGRHRKGQQTDTHRSGNRPEHFGDERKLDVVEQLIPLGEEAGLPMTHLAIAFVIAHPGVTSAILGPRTMEQLDDLLAGADVALDDEVLDRIDEIAPPGTDAGPNDVAYTSPAVSSMGLRRRPVAERSAA
jgi:hypothetical protein